MNKGKNINELTQTISEFDYNTRRANIPDWCPLYAGNVRCHTLEDLNCLECYCSFYDTTKQEGGCLRGSEQGKWFEHPNLPKGKIWDCSDCVYPHIKENVLEYRIKHLEKNENIKKTD